VGHSETVEVQGAGGGRVAAQLGDKAEFGEDERVARLRRDLCVPVADTRQIRLRGIQIPGPARAQSEAESRVDLA
jgi:hypothetical protein